MSKKFGKGGVGQLNSISFERGIVLSLLILDKVSVEKFHPVLACTLEFALRLLLQSPNE